MADNKKSNFLTITKIKLTNFKSHKNLEVSFKDLNVLIGENGSGKSSILEAICYCLFGAVASGAKKSELYKYGTKTGGVTLEFNNGYKLVRDLSTGIKLLDKSNNTITDKATEIESFFNIDKNVFMNILYASQNDIYNYFIKFNAKEKDFLDSVLNLDNLTDKISEKLKLSIIDINNTINSIQSNINTKNMIENNIKQTLESHNLTSIEDLSNSVENAKNSLVELKQKENRYKQREQLISRYNQDKAYYESNLKRYEELTNNTSISDKIKEADGNLNNYLEEIGNQLNMVISDINKFFKFLDNNSNINTYLDNLSLLIDTAIEHYNNGDDVSHYLMGIKETFNIIKDIDRYRSYYLGIKDNINRLINQKNIVLGQNDNFNREIDNLKNTLTSLNKNLEVSYNAINNIDISDISDVESLLKMAMHYQSQYTALSTTLNNLTIYMQQLDTINNSIDSNGDNDLERLQSLNDNINSITRIMPIFSRDGFVSFLRKSLLKDIATSIGDSLEKFGFTKLIPVTIDDKNGALLFQDRAFKSLSGGEKTIAAILLRILYARLLAPSMKLNMLLLDEPTADLDSVRVGYLRQLLTNINKTLNMQIIIVTHDSEVIPENANTITINPNF